jgi:hypothetical protein
MASGFSFLRAARLRARILLGATLRPAGAFAATTFLLIAGGSPAFAVNPSLAPTISKAFGAASIPVNGGTSLTLTINSVSGNTGVAFTDTLPAGLAVAVPAALNSNCAGGVAVATATSVALSSATIAANTSCTVSINVVGVTPGTKINSVTVNSNEGTGNTATATLTVNAALPPSIAKTFGAATIPVGGITSLVLTLTNLQAGAVSDTGVAFTDTLPAGLSVATPNNLTSSCPSGTVTAVAGSGTISLSGATLTAPISCNIGINVVGVTPGTKVNSVTVNSDQGVGNTATATITVNPALPPSIAKTFGATSIPVGGTTSLVFTLTNLQAGAVSDTGVAFTDTLPAGLSVATPNNLTSSCPSGTVTAVAGSGTISLSGATLTAPISCNIGINVVGVTPGTKVNSVTVNSDQGTGNTATATITVLGGTNTALTSSLNPSQVGQSVTFTATVTSSSGTPTGSVTFLDGATVLATVGLSGGVATFTTSTLTLGSHSITASYSGSATLAASVSPVLNQAVNTPTDSLKLRALQILVTPLEAQVSGQAISGAINSAISEGFADGGAFVTPSGSGVRFNFAADPDAARPAGEAIRSTDPFTSAGGIFDPAMRTSAKPLTSRTDDAFGALGYAGPVKAPRRIVEPREWLAWAEVRGAVLDRWGSSLTTPGASALYGNQLNLLAGLTRKFTPNFLIGVLGGYETFDYRSDALQGRLKGDGWTVGSYLGWKLTPGIRFDAGMAYSDIGYDGTAGTAAGSFSGHRWLFTSGLTGSYNAAGILIEPSARVYALWEHENAYTDTLGTLQGTRDFATGRASGGAQFSYPVAWTPELTLIPYGGLFGDYYFNSDSAGAAVALAGIPATVVLDGWSARAVGGIGARFSNGGQITVGGERGGIGGNVGIWTYRARASVPFGAR